MKKIAVAAIMQETSSFNCIQTTMQDFKDIYYKLGPDVVNVQRREWTTGGFVAEMKPRNFHLEGIISTFAGAGGEVSAETYAELKNTLLSGLKKAGPFDAVFMGDHGAMAADGEFDPEGDLLSEVRKVVGKDCFIGVCLDHHCNITQKAVDAVDVMLAFETQPHDFPASGAKAARIMLDIWDNKRTPHGALVKVPMLTPQDWFLTTGGPMKEWFDLAREIEKDPAVMVASTTPTQPWLDVPDNGWACLVYADTAEKARGYARKLGQKVWDLRDQFWRSERLSVPATVAAANAEPKGLVVISDTGDSTYGGAPGDSTAFISEMLKQGLNGVALVPVVDPEALDEARKAGIGRKITLRIGGKMNAGFSPSVDVTGVVTAFAEGGDLDFGNGIVSKTRPTALFECGNLKIAIQERREFSINHPEMYRKLGVDVGKAKMVVLKTASNFQYFKQYQSRLIRADSPGATQSDLTTLPWRNITHPMYPFDEIKNWRPS